MIKDGPRLEAGNSQPRMVTRSSVWNSASTRGSLVTAMMDKVCFLEERKELIEQ